MLESENENYMHKKSNDESGLAEINEGIDPDENLDMVSSALCTIFTILLTL